MKKAFDINKIKIVGGPDLPATEALASDKTKGLPMTSDVPANAELEGGEHLQYPDGVTQKVVGASHDTSGVKMALPDGTRVLSDSIKIGARLAKKMNKEHDLSLKSEHTFAQAIDKYKAKIGLTKLEKEQETYIKKLEKQQENPSKDKQTADVNESYLSKKINDLEKQKLEKEADKSGFFSEMFEEQEKRPKPKMKEKSETKMKFGGVISTELDKVIKDLGMDRKTALAYLDGVDIPKFDGGGKTGDERKKVSFENNEYTELEMGHQSANGKVYGDADFQKALEIAYHNFPKQAVKYLLKPGTDPKDLIPRDDINFNEENDQVKQYQKETSDIIDNSVKYIVDNPKKYSSEEVEAARNFLSNETYNTKEDGRVKSLDGKAGNFTLSRFLPRDYSLSEDARIKALEAGLTTYSQIAEQGEELGIDPDQVKIAQEKIDGGRDYHLGKYTPVQDIEKIDNTKPDDKKDPKDQESPTMPNIPLNTGSNSGYLFPDQSVLPPSAMDAHLKLDSQYGRVDPTRIGVENNIQEIANQRLFSERQSSDLPTSQRAALLANLMGQTNKATNQAISNANMVNAQNKSSAEVFNLGQQTRENMAENQNLMSFEQRQFTAEAKTEEELRSYLDFNRKVALNNLQNKEKLDLLQQMYDNFGIDRNMNVGMNNSDGAFVTSESAPKTGKDKKDPEGKYGGTYRKLFSKKK